MDYLTGIFDPGLAGYALITLILVQITVAAVTLYLHRDATHRGLDLHPVVRHFFRFWLWLTTGIVTKEWVAIHRKHHARCETPDDPHSPQIVGLKKVLLEGAELYQAEAKNAETIEKFGRGTPDDWVERHVYSGHPMLGIALMLVINFVLFGFAGLTIWAIQMMSQPVLAAGIVNGVGHHTGYRNFECDDAARNVVPWGFILGGEELHNNHHAFPSSARFSIRRWEFDIGWFYIRTLSLFGLAKVRRVAPTPVIAPSAPTADLETLRAVIVNRMHVLRQYKNSVTLPVFRSQIAGEAPQWRQVLRKAKKLLVRRPSLLDDSSRARLRELLDHNQTLKTVHEFRERLTRLWDGANVSNDRLLAQFREWCAQAEASGIKSLQEFARALQGYRMSPT